jgi:hypothetical protein
VTWVSGMNFGRMTKDQIVPIGAGSCKVVTTSPTKLTCAEDLGGKKGVSWADFPGNLTTFHNPVVVQGPESVDVIYLTGDSGSGATLWAVQNHPVTEYGSLRAGFGGVWMYPLAKDTVVGQPILDSTVPKGGDLTNKKLYFLQGFKGNTGTPQLTAISAADGAMKFEIAPKSPGKWGTEPNLVVDSVGNILFLSDHMLYGFSKEAKSLFAKKVLLSSTQLGFGPGGLLYSAHGATDTPATVNALIPSFQQTNAGPADLYSPTRLYVTGGPDDKAAKPWTLGARSAVILGEGFFVKMGDTLTVRVDAEK